MKKFVCIKCGAVWFSSSNQFLRCQKCSGVIKEVKMS